MQFAVSTTASHYPNSGWRRGFSSEYNMTTRLYYL